MFPRSFEKTPRTFEEQTFNYIDIHEYEVVYDSFDQLVSHNINVVLTRYLAHLQGKTPNSEIQIIMKLRSFTIIFIQVLKKMCINSSVYRYSIKDRKVKTC